MVGTTDDAVLKIRQEKVRQEMTEHDRKVIGASSVRLVIPMTDRYTLRRLPDLLRGMAAVIEQQSHRDDLTDRTILMEIKAEAYAFNSRMREIHGLSKFNKNGTLKVVDK